MSYWCSEDAIPMKRIINVIEVPTDKGIEYLVYYDDGGVEIQRDHPFSE